MVIQCSCRGMLRVALGSGDGERRTLLTRQIAFEPLPASVLFALLCWVWRGHGILLPPVFARREAISDGVSSAIGHHQITSLEVRPKRGMSRTILKTLSLAIPMNSERCSPLFRWMMSLALTRRVGMDEQLDIRQAMVAASVWTNLLFITLWLGRRSWANVRAMATPLAGANFERGVEVVVVWKHRKQRG